jgi:hypothetical protein
MDRQNYRTKIYHKLSFCIYPIIILLLTASGRAQQAPSNTNIAGPSASATGSVVNQAVQVLQGPYAMNTYGGGVSCQGPTMSISPFVLGNMNGSADPDAFQTHNGNAGISMGFNFPLDGSLTELCKERARTEIKRQQSEVEKSRLDFELVRAKLCLEMIRNGGFFHPESPYGKICADIVGPSPNGYLMTGNGTVVSKIKK